MPEIPECLNRRYLALDELIKDLSSGMSNCRSKADCPAESTTDVGIKLMCDFWNILKEDPDCDLTQAVQQRMGLNEKSNNGYRTQPVSCYMARTGSNNDNDESKKRCAVNKIKNFCCHSPEPESTLKCSASKSVSQSMDTDVLPLSKVLCNLKEAASFDKKCNVRVNELIKTQKQLQDQIQHLEHREKDGVELLKQADCMWSCMEDAYKKKISESLERQKDLLKQLKEVEASTTKWRKNKKDLEFQIDNVNKCQQEILDKINQKTNDIKCIEMEIGEFNKRIENNKKDAETAKKSLSNKKQASNLKITSISTEITKVQKKLKDEQKNKYDKEQEGNQYIKEAREDLQKICRVLLEKKLENEDQKAEREALILELDMLKQTCDQCRDKCKNKHISINNEIMKIDKEIAQFKVKCIRCHECTDTADVRTFCTDCPRCLEARDCLYTDGQCKPDHTMDCVCMSIKQKFLDNVFDNMYTVLEKEAKTGPGKAVAEAVLRCLKKSRNGKLNEETRKILQDFILTTVKKNLNLTIVGGAVKTRCEMDAETYNQLMLCLKEVKLTQPLKVDVGTVAKKEPCRRWGGTSECNCPKGPKSCICTKKALPPPNDPTPCPPPEKEDISDVVACPHKEGAPCGADCALHTIPSCVGADVASWSTNPCKEQVCPFSKNMRAAQCFLGPESLSSLSNLPESIKPDISVLPEQIMCNCGNTPKKPCTCRGDVKYVKTTLMTECNKSTCVLIWDQGDNEIELRDSTKEYKENINITDTEPKNKKDKAPLVVSKQSSFSNKNITFGKQSNDVADCSFSNALKISILNENGGLDVYFTDIINTPSGGLAMKVDEKVIHFIENRIKDDPNLLVYLNEKKSGYFLIDFAYKESAYCRSKRLLINRTPSGTMSFKVEKGHLKTIKPSFTQSVLELNDELAKKSSICIKLSKTSKVTNKSSTEHVKKITNVTNYQRNETDKVSHKSVESFKTQLENQYNYGTKHITLKIQADNNYFKYADGRLLKTKSGNIAIIIKNVCIFNNIFDKTDEAFISLDKSDSVTFLIDINGQHNNKVPNASLKKDSQENLIVVLADTYKESQEIKINSDPVHKGNFYKMRIKGIENIGESPAILKLTPSENYIIVVDKEFEKKYIQTISDYMDDNCKCSLDLVRTDSGNYEIIFGNSSVSQQERNAFIVKSPSGNIKILVNGPAFETLSRTSGLNPNISIHNSFSEIIEKMFDKLPSTCQQVNTEQVKQSKLLATNSKSDSHLHEKVKFRLQNQQILLSDPSALLKKINSGQYAIVTNKKSKITFMNTLKSYLARKSLDIIPIKRINSREITIMLNNDDGINDQNGSLKITPSGNIYILINETVIKSIKNCNLKRECDEYIDHFKSYPYNINTANKAVTTTCNFQPDDCSCDDVTRCFCKELQCQYTNTLENSEEMENIRLFRPEMCGIDWRKVKRRPNKIYKICDPNKCSSKCCPNDKKHSKYVKTHIKSPHIAIKPRETRLAQKKDSQRNKHCFYLTESVCPYHKDRYDNVSNELLEISGLCNKVQGQKNKLRKVVANLTYTRNAKSLMQPFDYLDTLPPQLPYFLNNYHV
ncbi:uncharacterized protein LOC131850912 [Achroia grisella]|uniref:uncharacterized protein LOC131850912 n=1 Tax=Achroia grisella TaxID=688607 RepID=UPI0027D2519A|nr:uncharacterized protein LOC131850912 [Achroia grisella]